MTNWKGIDPDFTPELQKEWVDKGFDYQECKEWVNVGLWIIDADYAKWLRDVKKITPKTSSDGSEIQPTNSEETYEQYQTKQDKELRKQYWK